MGRRSYDQHCAIARALDVIGERWAMLIVRELLSGPRRYTDLHADLPGVSTDVLAARLKELEGDGVVERRRLPSPATGHAYDLTARGRALLPALSALAEWGGAELGAPRPTDAVRAHWSAIPLIRRLGGVAAEGILDVRLDEGAFHLDLTPAGATYHDGAAPKADATLTLTPDACHLLVTGAAEPHDVTGARVQGDTPLADAVRAAF
ncbi:winged helix-turn-helix transcriptional regulator [Spongiactinospora sp. TRM90649]|uniref:winged helix-turn-helix transcriptional regulator n=1 Tax=Spongiactinospora sp. TRM90649 TaxID=3031114 RepID=UPI0023FA2414|nr:winged helix-turn-helix transcriptional regulator [Spongiactinospora sp. TRM90649]MDF5751073.1 winged helix-turn-helix transcriptional regulator [Spongiactinospora sp. TRM90649]